jgi:hypothetical protein
VSTTLSARFVRRPRQRFVCDWCGRMINGPYIRLYGMADTERPWTLRLHPTAQCCPNLNGDTKIAAALKEGEAPPAVTDPDWPAKRARVMARLAKINPNHSWLKEEIR